MMKPFTLLLVFLGFAVSGFAQETGNAQNSSSASDIKFVAVGDFFTGMKWTPAANNKPEQLSFTTTGINPVFLWSISNNLLVESEVEIQLQGAAQPYGYATGEGLAIELEYANVGYFLNDYAILRAGTFFSSMGVFEDWYHQRITNRFIDRPIGIGHGGLESGGDLGFNLTGGIPLGSAKMNYSLDLTTGPRLITAAGSDEGSQGQLIYEGINDNNEGKNIGVKLGFLPLANSSLEFGGSFNRALVGNVNSSYAGVGATFIAGYLSYVKEMEEISGTILFRGQYDNLKIDDANYPVAGDTTGKTFTFTNASSAYYAYFTYRPSMVNSFIRKFELGVRYGNLMYPADAPWGKEQSQFAVSLDYWITWNAVAKIQYEQNHVVSQHAGTITQPPANVQLQLAMGF